MNENLLRHESSPYLLQHQDNPVHWRAWGPAALAEAKRENKPILLSVGYAACHWCHVMAHESFEDPATAAVMNRHFVNIKVDREERPDIDQTYMAALHSLGEQGGWPLTMFLAPDGTPIWGGTYFPNTARFGRPSFVDVLEEVARIVREEPEKAAANRTYIMERLERREPGQPIRLDRALLDAAAERLLGLADPVNGGTRGAPKFPQAGLLELLFRAHLRTGNPAYLRHIDTTLAHIAEGGITDHLGGGFARYSVDERWLVPHFEKMLYDNAALIELMSYAFVATGRALYRDRVAEAVAFLEREMTTEDAFAASIDADSEGHEGRFYVWSLPEVIEILGTGEGAFFANVYDVTEEGNFEGANILNRLLHMHPLSPPEEERLARARALLLARRDRRARPATDDKVLADWNGLAIAALATAGSVFARRDWIDRAARAYRFILATMARNGRLAHSWRRGKAVHPGLATDHAAFCKAALALAAATGETSYLIDAERFSDVLQQHYYDRADPGYYLSADDAEALIIRPRSLQDEATPSATSLHAANLIRLWRLTGKDDYRATAEKVIGAASAAVAENLFATAGIQSALDLALNAIDVVIVHDEGTDPASLLAAARARLTPNVILSVHTGTVGLSADHPAAGKIAIDSRPTAYVCRGETCSLPVTEPAALAALIDGGS